MTGMEVIRWVLAGLVGLQNVADCVSIRCEGKDHLDFYGEVGQLVLMLTNYKSKIIKTVFSGQ